MKELNCINCKHYSKLNYCLFWDQPISQTLELQCDISMIEGDDK